MYGCNADSLFCLKALMKRVPFRFNLILLVTSVFIFGHAIRVCEGPIARLDKEMDYHLMSEAMWSVVVTMTTRKCFYYNFSRLW